MAEQPTKRRKPGRPAAPHKRRRQILESASRLFFEKGYRQTTLDDIATELGITGPALYHYFRQKEELLFEIRVRIINDSIDRIRKVLESDERADEKLRTILSEQILTTRLNVAPNVVFGRERGHLSEEREQTIRKLERGYLEMLTGLYSEGVEARLFRDVPPRLAIGALLAACNWTYHFNAPKAGFTEAEIAELLEGMLLRGTLLEPPAEGGP